jgi:hypothetical protein
METIIFNANPGEYVLANTNAEYLYVNRGAFTNYTSLDNLYKQLNGVAAENMCIMCDVNGLFAVDPAKLTVDDEFKYDGQYLALIINENAQTFVVAPCVVDGFVTELVCSVINSTGGNTLCGDASMYGVLLLSADDEELLEEEHKEELLEEEVKEEAKEDEVKDEARDA